jgi:hypothetical protein
VIVTFGIDIERRLSQVAASADDASTALPRVEMRAVSVTFIRPPRIRARVV